MRLKHSEVGGAENKQTKAKYFAAAAVLIAGLAFNSKVGVVSIGKERLVRDTAMAATQENPNSGCESVFTSEAEQVIEERLKSAVVSHSDELKSQVGGDGRILVKFSVGVDGRGGIRLEDAWTTPHSELSARNIANITRVSLGSIQLNAPSEGHMCSYSTYVVIDNKT